MAKEKKSSEVTEAVETQENQNTTSLIGAEVSFLNDQFESVIGVVTAEKGELLTIKSNGETFKRALAEGFCELTGNRVEIAKAATATRSTVAKANMSREIALDLIVKAKNEFLGRTISFITRLGLPITADVKAVRLEKGKSILLVLKGHDGKNYFKSYSENMTGYRFEEGFDQELFDKFDVEKAISGVKTAADALQEFAVRFANQLTSEQAETISSIVKELQAAQGLNATSEQASEEAAYSTED